MDKLELSRAAAEARRAREAEALRENLRRRKAQQRAREDAAKAEPVPEPDRASE